MPRRLRNWDRRGAAGLVYAYQAIVSPWLGPACRYEPSCSQYAAEAIEKYGVMRGSWLGARRLSRCHPLGSSGYDPVP
jgi:putative membrane protein insertion efficiency factor